VWSVYIKRFEGRLGGEKGVQVAVCRGELGRKLDWYMKLPRDDADTGGQQERGISGEMWAVEPGLKPL
jgi:hypothetical protein